MSDCAYAEKSVIASTGAYCCPFRHYVIKPHYFARKIRRKKKKEEEKINRHTTTE